jgi:acetyl-CoA C-acetyltransferase
VAEAREVVVLSGVRTAVGKYGGSLKDMPPADLGAAVVREAVSRSGLEPAEVGHTVFGNVIHTETRDMYLSRVASVNGGLPVETPAFTLNRLCGSGLQAIVSAAQLVMLGDTDAALAGGVESMSRGLYGLPALRWGARMGETSASDMMVGALTDPFDDCHMGVTAENVAGKWGISREDQDALAVQSHQRAARATTEGYFKEQILPIELKSRKGTTVFDTDEHVRPDATMEGMAKLRPVFNKEGSVTAGNAAGINDAAAAVVLADSDYAERKGLAPMGRLVAYAHAGVEPKYMGIGPVPAVRKLLARAGMTIDQIDLVEMNEAFASQAHYCQQELGIPDAKLNVNGGAIALGHPLGCSGARLMSTLLNELERTGGRYGLQTMCEGGGLANATIIERLG